MNMNLFIGLYIAALFVALTPGVLLTLPKVGARLTVAVIHALVFAVVYQLTYRMVWRNSVTIDGFALTAPGYIPGTAGQTMQKFTDPEAAYKTGVCSMSPFPSDILTSIVRSI